MADYITTNTTNLLDLNYPFLKQQGINYIRQLAGNIWTDYNEHDPGITILEELCFAIVDLEYRTNFYIEDILEPNPDDTAEVGLKQFYVAEEILPCNPLTKNDFLKLILDVNGVKNAKIFFSQSPEEVQGGYKILLDLEDRIVNKGQANQIIEQVREKLYKHRNLCEDFFSIQLLEPHYLHINAAIELNEGITQEEGEALIAEIFFSIQSFIAPYVKFYSLREMLIEKKKTVDEIFTGPLLEQGFIDHNELERSNIQREIYISEILKKVTAIKQVQSVTKFTVGVDGQTDPSTKMAIDVPVDKVLKVDIEHSNIMLYHRGIPLSIDASKVKRLTEEIVNARVFKRPYLTEEEINVPEGRYRNLNVYTSIQNDFPLIYGVGQEGLAESDSPARKVQAQQLKAYLMFFDQLFANYLGQLAQIKDLMAVQKKSSNIDFSQIPGKVPVIDSLIKKPGTPVENTEDDIDRNFKIQRKHLGINWKSSKNKEKADNPTDIEAIYRNYLSTIIDVSKDYTTKKNNILDHLLARFSEAFTDRTMQLYDACHKTCLAEIKHNKELFLEDYIPISRDRNKATDLVNTQNEGWDIENISGFERRMCRSLGIRNLKRRFLYESLKSNFYLEQNFEQQSFELFLSENLQTKFDNLIVFKGNFPKIKDLAIRHGNKESNYDIAENAAGNYEIILYIDKQKQKSIRLLNKEVAISNFEQAQAIIKQIATFFQTFNKESEGFHLVEHIMLRTSDMLTGTHDPYSFMMTLVFPTWPARFQREDFKNLVHEFIMLESPAHIFVNIIWLDLVEMETFEKAHKDWLFYRTTEDVNDPKLKEAARHLLGLIMLYSKDQE
ncbi:MAG: hypothetical protein BGO68_03050 [Candidatus Amoebophilus sp. 36-38]|nr:MAG: hypothetical protein BGO68_03050 [Candidatus Amoebophilus sp. 36-38]